MVAGPEHFTARPDLTSGLRSRKPSGFRGLSSARENSRFLPFPVQVRVIIKINISAKAEIFILVAGPGLEPGTFGLWARRAANCSTPLYCCESGRPDSNRRPSPWQGDVLPTELLPHFVFIILAKKPCFVKPYYD